MSQNYSLSRINYDTALRRVTDVSQFAGETPNTIFFNGIIAIVRADAPDTIPFTNLQYYLANALSPNTSLRFYTLNHQQSTPPVRI